MLRLSANTYSKDYYNHMLSKSNQIDNTKLKIKLINLITKSNLYNFFFTEKVVIWKNP